MRLTQQMIERGAARHEALRGQVLRISQRCFPEWSKVMTLACLDGFVKWIVSTMPPEIGWLEREDGQQTGGTIEDDYDPAVAAALEARQTEGPCSRCGQMIDNLGTLRDLYAAMKVETEHLPAIFRASEQSRHSLAACSPPKREDDFVEEMKKVLKRSALRHEALRRRLLRISERCFPEWFKVMTIAELESLNHWIYRSMPYQIWWLELDDGKSGPPTLESDNNAAVIAGARAAQAEGHCSRCGQMLDVGGLLLNWYPGIPNVRDADVVVLASVKGRPTLCKQRGRPEKRDYTKPW